MLNWERAGRGLEWADNSSTRGEGKHTGGGSSVRSRNRLIRASSVGIVISTVVAADSHDSMHRARAMFATQLRAAEQQKRWCGQEERACTQTETERERVSDKPCSRAPSNRDRFQSGVRFAHLAAMRCFVSGLDGPHRERNSFACSRSYVWPSDVMTGSRMMFRPMGQRNTSGTR